jgi:hypothetical protein
MYTYLTIFLNLSNLLFLIILIRRFYNLESPFLSFWFIYTSVYFVPGLFDFNSYEINFHPLTPILYLDTKTLFLSQAFILFFISSMYFINIFILHQKLSRSQELHFEKFRRNIFVIFVVAMFSIGLLRFVFLNGVNLNFTESREIRNIYDLILIQYNSYILVGISVDFFRRKEYIKTIFIFFALLISILFIGGSRQPLLIFGLALALAWIQKRQFGLIYLYISIFAVPLAIQISRFLIYIRNLDGMNERLSFILSGDYHTINESTSIESNLRFAWYYIFQNQDIYVDRLFNWEYFYRILAFWIPSFIFPGIKPDDFEFTLYEILFGNYGGSLHLTFFGSIYFDTGYNILPWLFLFVLFQIFYIFMIKWTPQFFHSIIWSLFVYLATLWSRGSIYAPILVLAYSLGLILVFTFVFRMWDDWTRPRRNVSSVPLRKKVAPILS